MMGTLWNRSGMVERHADDLRASGAKAYFFLGGTVTPMTVYQDAGESTAFAHPVVADADGRWPDVFIPYIISYDVRVTDAADVQLTYSLQIPNPSPTDISVTVPADQVVQTGMIHCEFIDGTRAGYVRCNGRTIGNGASSASERANADTSALFVYLWNACDDVVCPVSTGRGASGAADFAANKNIGLPDLRSCVPAGLDTMGNASSAQFVGLIFNYGTPTTVGAFVGGNQGFLEVAMLPAHTHTGTTAVGGAHTHALSGILTTAGPNADHAHTFSGVTLGQSVDHSHAITPTGLVASGNAGTLGPSNNLGTATLTSTAGTSNDHTHSYSGTTSGQTMSHSHQVDVSPAVVSASSTHSHTFTTSSVGSGTPFPNMQNSKLVTWYIKL